MRCEIVYSPNGNHPARTLILLHNGANTSEKSICSDNLINLVEPLINFYTRPIFVNCCQDFAAQDTLFFIDIDVESKPCNNIGYGVFGHIGFLSGTLY